MARTSDGPCVLEKARLDPVRPCLTNYLDPAPREQEWANASISSLRAVAYSCGAIARRGDAIAHDHDPAELALCRRLSAEAAKVMEGVVVGMGSPGTDDYFAPFFVAASRGAKVPARLTEEVIRAAIGGTIYPGVEIVTEPLGERGQWWTQVLEFLVDNDDALKDDEIRAVGEEELERWRAMIRWFRARPELHGIAFVTMRRGDEAEPDWAFCNFPYLALGITAAGSLVGIWGNYLGRRPTVADDEANSPHS